MARNGESLTSIRRIEAREKQAKALEYRKGGVTYQRIADILGYTSHKGAEKAIKSALDRITDVPAKELVKLELERLDAMLMSIWKRVSKGDFGAIDRAIRIAERRARYEGLDKPQKTALTDTEGENIVTGFEITIINPDETKD